jgi:hypothetical protein
MPAVVGSLFVLSANPLAGFFFARNVAFLALCTQKTRNARLVTHPGQFSGPILGNPESWDVTHRNPTTLVFAIT